MMTLLVFINILQLIVYIFDVVNRNYKKEPIKQTEAMQIKRRSGNIKTSDYTNVFNNRTSYKIYQNENGLYEPQKPSKGIDLKREAK